MKRLDVNQRTDRPSFDNKFNPDQRLDAKEFGKIKEQDNLNADNGLDNNNEKECQESKAEPIQNKIDGCRREEEVKKELEEQYPKEGYTIESEVYLRDENGNIVKDPVTGEARRIDFVVIKDGKVVDSIEVTSKTADKTEQCAKEKRIRENGGNFIKTSNGELIEIPDTVETRIERRD